MSLCFSKLPITSESARVVSGGRMASLSSLMACRDPEARWNQANN